MKLIYLAGGLTPRGVRPETNNAAIEYLLNSRDLIRAGIECLKKGWAPFCPALDLQYFLALQPGEVISEETIKEMSLAWLDASDAILMLPRWESSIGAQMEYRRAVEAEMPIFKSMGEVPDDSE